VAHLAADLAVILPDDRPGMLAKAIGCVSARGINIRRLLGDERRSCTADARPARREECLNEAGFRVCRNSRWRSFPWPTSRAPRGLSENRRSPHQRALQLSRDGNRLVIASDDPQAVINAVGTPDTALRPLEHVIQLALNPFPARRSPRSRAAGFMFRLQPETIVHGRCRSSDP